MVTEKSQGFNITNETGTEERTSFLKNIIGLWLIQESRRQWIREGREYSFSELEEMAKETEPLKRFIDPMHRNSYPRAMCRAESAHTVREPVRGRLRP